MKPKLKHYAVRYTWKVKGKIETATTVASGRNPQDALERFKRDNPHLLTATVIP